MKLVHLVGFIIKKFYVHFVVTVSRGTNFLMSTLTLFKYCTENEGMSLVCAAKMGLVSTLEIFARRGIVYHSTFF